MKKVIGFAVIAIALLLFTNCNIEEERVAMVNMDKMNFAFYTRLFSFQIVIDGETVFDPVGGLSRNRTHTSSPYFDPFYTELIFVHSQAEAQGFPYNVIVAWPRENERIVQDIVDRLNNAASRTVADLPSPDNVWGHGRRPISLRSFGFEEPITIADLVDNWENVIAVWNALTQTERDGIR